MDVSSILTSKWEIHDTGWPRSISLWKSRLFLHFKIISRHSVVIHLRWHHRNIQIAMHENARQKNIRKTDFVDIFWPTHCIVTHIQLLQPSHGLWSRKNIQQPQQTWRFILSYSRRINHSKIQHFPPGEWHHQTALRHHQLFPSDSVRPLRTPTSAVSVLSSIPTAPPVKCWGCAPKWKRKTPLKQVNCISYI